MRQRIPLNKFTTILRGVTPAPKEEIGEGLPFIGQMELGHGGAQPLRMVRYQSQADEVEPTYLRANDLVIAAMDSKRRVYMVPESAEGAVLGRECLAVRVESTWHPVSAHYLLAWMNTADFRRQADAMAAGIAMPRLTQKSLGSLEVPLADSARQDRIVNLSMQFGKAIGDLRTTLAQVEELESIELEIAFGDDDEFE